MAKLQMVAINKGGNRVLINASDYDDGRMKLWGEKDAIKEAMDGASDPEATDPAEDIPEVEETAPAKAPAPAKRVKKKKEEK